jgi:hypothetical protein
VLRVGRSFNASGILGFVYIILFPMFRYSCFDVTQFVAPLCISYASARDVSGESHWITVLLTNLDNTHNRMHNPIIK